MRTLTLSLALLISPASFAATGLEVGELAWDYPTTAVNGGSLTDAIVGSGIYCRAEGELMPAVPIDVPAPQTSINLGSISLPDGNVYCAVDVYVQIRPDTLPLRSGVTSEVFFFVEAGTFYYKNPAA